MAQPDWLDYSGQGRRLGPETAPVVLVEFADYQCPACRVLEGRLQAIREKYPNDVAVIYRHFPLPSHAFAEPAAVASECAGRQGRFEPMHRLFYADQQLIGQRSWREFADSAAVADLEQFDACIRDTAVFALVANDKAAALRVGATGTPTLLINGIRVAGSVPQPILDSLVASALEGARSGRR